MSYGGSGGREAYSKKDNYPNTNTHHLDREREVSAVSMTRVKFRESIRKLIEYVKETVDPKASEEDKHIAGKRAERTVKELFDWYDSKED